MKPLPPVIQLDATGCALATIATLARKPYLDIKQRAAALGIHPEDQSLWSETGYFYRLAKDQGIQLAEQPTPFTDWESLPDLAVLSIKWHQVNDRPFWHWVVFQRTEQGNVVLDSKKALKTHHRTDFGRIKPKWFIEVL